MIPSSNTLLSSPLGLNQPQYQSNCNQLLENTFSFNSKITPQAAITEFKFYEDLKKSEDHQNQNLSNKNNSYTSNMTKKCKIYTNQCKKVILTNQPTSILDTRKAVNDTVCQISPQNSAQGALQKEQKDNLSFVGQPLDTQLPKKDLFNELLITNNKNTSKHSNRITELKDNISDPSFPNPKCHNSERSSNIPTSSTAPQNSHRIANKGASKKSSSESYQGNYPYYYPSSSARFRISSNNGASLTENNQSEVSYLGYPYYHPNSLQAPYEGEEIDFATYNEMYPGYYYPHYMPIDFTEGKKLEEEHIDRKDITQSEEYKKYYLNHPHFAYGNPTLNESHHQTTQEAQSSNSQSIQEQYDQSYLRGYYDSNVYYPSYYYPSFNEIYPIENIKKNSKRSSSHSNKYESNAFRATEASFHDQQLNYSSSIYCDPSYYCIDPTQKSSNSNIESSKGFSSKDNKQKNKVLIPLKAVEATDSDLYGNDNQESSQQNNQSTSHEIRKRKRKNNDQLKILKIEYQKGGFWGKEKILEVALFTGLSESQVYKWCWDQKKKRLETFKKRLGNKLFTGNSLGSEVHFEDMSDYENEEEEEESYKHTGSPEKQIKLNDETGAVPLKANISKLTNDFTISQLQEKAQSVKGRALQNITDKILSRQNSKQPECSSYTSKHVITKVQNNNNINNICADQKPKRDQENIMPEKLISQQQQQQQSLDEIQKRLHFNSAF